MKIVLYTRAGCHLCDQVAQLLRERGLPAESIDIDSDRELQEKYGAEIPVVEIDGKVRYRGQLNPVLLDRFIRSG